MTEHAIDELLRNFQRSCEEVALADNANTDRKKAARAFLRNRLRAELVEGERLRAELQECRDVYEANHG